MWSRPCCSKSKLSLSAAAADELRLRMCDVTAPTLSAELLECFSQERRQWVRQLKSGCTVRARVSEMLGGSRQFVELVDDEAEQPAARCAALRIAQSYLHKTMRRRPVFLALFELMCPKLFYGWVVVFSCGIGWWCVAPAGKSLFILVRAATTQTMFFQSHLRRWRVRRLLAHRSRYNARGPFRCNAFFHCVLLCLRLFTAVICLFLTLLQPWTFSYLAAFSQRAPRHAAADVNFNAVATGTGPWPSF
jgi:hypothetical protein